MDLAGNLDAWLLFYICAQVDNSAGDSIQNTLCSNLVNCTHCIHIATSTKFFQ